MAEMPSDLTFYCSNLVPLFLGCNADIAIGERRLTSEVALARKGTVGQNGQAKQSYGQGQHSLTQAAGRRIGPRIIFQLILLYAIVFK
jgi:hypothetical protein